MLAHSQRRYQFKIAESELEREQLGRLLYRTFVLEIPRYKDPGTGFLVDRFDEGNVYFIAIHDGCVCGMMAVHEGPEFSVSTALQDKDQLSQLRKPLLEARIFAVKLRHRTGIVFAGLACSVYRYAADHGYANILISGLERRERMYRRMGFKSLGPAVRRGKDQFVPMSFDVENVPEQVQRDLDRWSQLL